ncbi:MAG: hypothetical protein VB099_12700 [Candidatus Limiplasma sp.]|nr:hypothetical protein [Candidatus Limiplasma sp.]
MDGPKSQMVAEIKAAIANETLSEAEMKRRLMHAIEYELSQTDREADLALVDACQSLLLELHSQAREEPPADRRAESLAAVRLRLRRHLRRQTVRKGVVRGVSVAAAMVVLSLGVDILFRRQWLSGQSTLDGQDYMVQGNVVDPGTVQAGTANEIGEVQFVSSTDLEEASSILSFTPPALSWLPQGWELLQYEGMVIGAVEYFYSVYHQPGTEKLLRYEIHINKDISANLYAEQNEDGTQLKLENGATAYLSMNFELPTCAWFQNEMFFLISGPLTQDEILQMINSID